MLGTSGNLSILIQEEPLQFLITASGKDKGELTDEDFLLVNENADCIDHDNRNSKLETRNSPSAETLLHSSIYRCTDAKVVFHVHTVNSTLLSQLASSPARQFASSPVRPLASSPVRQLEFSGLEMLKGLGFKTHDVTVSIPVIENSQDMKYLASIVPNYINEEVPGLVLNGHGIYGWGRSLQETKRHVEIFEFLFEYRVKELSLTNRL